MNGERQSIGLRAILIVLFFAVCSALLLLYTWLQSVSWGDVTGDYRRRLLEDHSLKLAYFLRNQLAAGPVNAAEAEWLEQAGRLFGASIRYVSPNGEQLWYASRLPATGLGGEDERYTVELPHIAGGEQLGRLVLSYDLRSGEAFRDLDAAEEQLGQQRRIMLGALLALAAVVSLLAGRLLSKPLEVLAAAADKIAAGSRELAVPKPGASETKRLAAALNGLLQESGEQERWRQRMMQDLMHELRTPLTSILHRLEAMQDGVYPASETNLGKMYAELDRLSRYVDDMNKLSEAEAARFQLRPTRTDLSELARSAWEDFLFLADEKSIELTFFPSYEPCIADIDPDRIVQVIANLLSNALKYTDPGGRVELGVLREGPFIVLKCKDNGIGIFEEELPHVFRRFYRARRPVSGFNRGLGVGLSIVRALVEAHGGTVSAESTPGEGSVFTVALPAASGGSGVGGLLREATVS